VKCGTGVAQFRYLGTRVTNQNLIQEEIRRRLNSVNACYHSVQSILPSRLLSTNIKIRIYKTIILPVVLYGCKTWPLTLKEEHRLKVFENRVLRRIFGPKRDEVTGGWRKLHNEELVPTSIDWAQLSRFHLNTETDPVSETLCVLNKNRTMDNVQKQNNRIILWLI
jgi:hypothetical protein